MATSNPIYVKAFKAGADLSAKQFYWVEQATAGVVTVCNAATDKSIGVLQNTPENGETAEVCMLGETKVNSDAALSLNDLIGPSADGQSDAKTPGTDTTEYVHGIVTEASSAAGGYATAFISCVPFRAA